MKVQTNPACGLAGGPSRTAEGGLLVDGGEVLIRDYEGGPSEDSDDKG